MTDWPVKTLDALCDEGVVLLGRGNIISKKDIAANPGPYPIYSSARENEGKFGEYGDFMFDEEMITWSIDGGGRLFYRPKHKFSVTNVGGTLRVLNPKVLEIRYLHRALENLHSQKVFDWVFKAHPSVIRKVYDEIPVPPLEEQKRIVALLDAATARVTELTACYEQARTHANNLFTSALSDALEENPDWPVKTLGDICVGIVRQDPAVSGQTEFTYIDLSAINQVTKQIDGFRIIAIDEAPGRARQLVKSGDVLVATVRPNLNAVALVGSELNGATASTGFCVLRPNRSIVEPGHLFAWARNQLFVDELTSQAKGASYPAVTDDVVKALELPVPPLEEQRRIVARLDAMRAKTSEMVTAYDAKLNAAKNLRQSILEAAFAGEL